MLPFVFLAEIADPAQKDVFMALYTAYRDELYYDALNRVNDEQLAEDVVQDTYFFIARNIENVKDPASASTRAYLHLTLKGFANRLQRKFRDVPVDYDPFELPAEDDVEDAAFESIDRAALAARIRELPEIYRDPLLLFYAQDLPTKEIAKLLGVTDAVVRKRLERARKLLAKAMEPYL